MDNIQNRQSPRLPDIKRVNSKTTWLQTAKDHSKQRHQ